MRCRGAGGASHRHRGRRRDGRAVAATDNPFGSLEAGPRDHLLDVGGPVESHDRGLAENGLDPAQRTHRVVADRRPGARPDVRGQPDALADGEGRRLLLLGARGTTWLGTRAGAWSRDRHNHRRLVVPLRLFVIVLALLNHDHLDVHVDHVLRDVRLGSAVEGGLLRRLRGGTGGCGVWIWCASGHI